MRKNEGENGRESGIPAMITLFALWSSFHSVSIYSLYWLIPVLDLNVGLDALRDHSCETLLRLQGPVYAS